MAEGTESSPIQVEVAYALPDVQKIIALEVAPGTTAYEAAVRSGIDRHFPLIDLETSDMGVFGKAIKPREYRLHAGDRVEIYRPLLADPKEVRKKRAAAASRVKKA
jgi:putative ubiquitin-RnfH superfamily antitoxin RatB of RatAB toxin-antitoxin module